LRQGDEEEEEEEEEEEVRRKIMYRRETLGWGGKE
jgi:hypothetical protein